ncbi:MAG: hypothetical protein U0802_15890 [Candidatus Binatia bacterium]
MRSGWWVGAVLVCSVTRGALPARAADFWANLDLLGQVRESYQTRETEAPTNLYSNLGLSHLWHASETEAYFRLEQDLASDQNASDFYAGYARVPNALPGVQATVGRQFISEGPGNVFVADAGKVNVDVGWPVMFTVYGGAPQYFEPTYSTPIISQDELLWGGNARTTRWRGGQLSLGYQQWERQGKVLQQLVSANAVQVLDALPLTPRFYGTFGYDADRANVDTATGGVDVTVPEPLLLLNVATTYYQPQDNAAQLPDVDWQEDPIFQYFSNSNLWQARGGVRRPFSRSLSIYGDFSYQNYDNAVNENVNGYLAHAGLLWLPEGDGLEQVLTSYYLATSPGGTVNGVSLYYENRVYERVTFRFRADVAYYEKESNQNGWPVATRTGLAYEFLPGLDGQLIFEANRNAFIDADFRFGFALSYNFRHPVSEGWNQVASPPAGAAAESPS